MTFEIVKSVLEQFRSRLSIINWPVDLEIWGLTSSDPDEEANILY